MDPHPATALRLVMDNTLTNYLCDLVTQKCQNVGEGTVLRGLIPLDEFIDEAEREEISPSDLVTQFREKVKSYARQDFKYLFTESDFAKGTSCLLKALSKTQPELDILKHCPQCVLNYYDSQKGEDWFSTPCSTPHAVVWAWTDGCPFWPAKVLSAKDGIVTVFYFGNKHETDTLSHDRIRLIDDRLTYPMRKSIGGQRLSKKWDDLNPSIASAQRYIKKLKKVFTNPPLHYGWPSNEKFSDDKAVFPFKTTSQANISHPDVHEAEAEAVRGTGSRISSVQQAARTCEIQRSSTEGLASDLNLVYEEKGSEEPDAEEKSEEEFNAFKEQVMHSKEVVTVQENDIQKLLQDNRWISNISVPRVGACIDLEKESTSSDEESDCLIIDSCTKYGNMTHTDDSSIESEPESIPDSEEQPQDSTEILLRELEQALIKRREVKEELQRVTEQWKSLVLSVPPEMMCQICHEMPVNKDFRCGRNRFCSEQCLAKFRARSVQIVEKVTQSSSTNK